MCEGSEVKEWVGWGIHIFLFISLRNSFLKILTDNKTFLKTTKHITQHQQFSKVDINRQLPHHFADKSQLSITRIDRAILHVNGQSSNLQ